jgi:hypothetical protein
VATYTMSDKETQAWEQDDAERRDMARYEIRGRAINSTTPDSVEVYSVDGVCMDVVREAT